MSGPTDETTPAAGERADIPPPTADDMAMDLFYEHKWAMQQGNIERAGLVRRLAAVEANAARLRARVAELEGAVSGSEDALCNVAQLLDGWHNDGTAWTEWDESVRESIVRVQQVFAALLAPEISQ